jgi:zinc protease
LALAPRSARHKSFLAQRRKRPLPSRYANPEIVMNFHHRWRAASALALFVITPVALGRAPQIKYSDTTLPNGLRVIISEDHAAPVFSVVVNYNVGSRNERPGRTGFAHLFEHMMFKGSENVGQGEHPYLMFVNGGNMNGTTNKDRTMYYETLPANQVDLALFLEADRMRSLAITKENLDNQRNAVQEERRLGIDNQPYGKVGDTLTRLAFENFAYGHSTIGSMDDLSAATVEDVSQFFRMYYAPNNATLAIVGDVDTQATLAKVKKYFGAIPRQATPAAVDMTEPPQTEEHRVTLQDPLARLPRIDMAYKVPPSSSPDYDALSVLATVLAGGRSGRFYENLVRQKQLATNANVGIGESRGPGLFTIVASPAPNASLADLEAAIDTELERVKTGPIADAELEKARSAAQRSYISIMGSSLGRAISLSQDAIFYDAPDWFAKNVDRVNKVTAADVQRVATQYFTHANRTVVITMPKSAARGGL